jgi:hypothetical protein
MDGFMRAFTHMKEGKELRKRMRLITAKGLGIKVK